MGRRGAARAHARIDTRTARRGRAAIRGVRSEVDFDHKGVNYRPRPPTGRCVAPQDAGGLTATDLSMGPRPHAAVLPNRAAPPDSQPSYA
jgi:hypothetical protein